MGLISGIASTCPLAGVIHFSASTQCLLITELAWQQKGSRDPDGVQIFAKVTTIFMIYKGLQWYGYGRLPNTKYAN